MSLDNMGFAADGVTAPADVQIKVGSSERLEMDRPVHQWPILEGGPIYSDVLPPLSPAIQAGMKAVRVAVAGVLKPALHIEGLGVVLIDSARSGTFPRFTPNGAAKDKPTVYPNIHAAVQSADARYFRDNASFFQGPGSGERALRDELDAFAPSGPTSGSYPWDEATHADLVQGGLE